jgi:small nuclear ribonucleoprotein (snRNP)-like protein
VVIIAKPKYFIEAALTPVVMEEEEYDEEYYGTIFQDEESFAIRNDVRRANYSNIGKSGGLGQGKQFALDVKKARDIIRNAEMGLLGPAGLEAVGKAPHVATEAVTVSASTSTISKRKREKGPDPMLNSLSIIMLHLQGKDINIELKNDWNVQGTLESVDRFMNCTIINAIITTTTATTATTATTIRNTNAMNSNSNSIEKEIEIIGKEVEIMNYNEYFIKGTNIRLVIPPIDFNARSILKNVYTNTDNHGHGHSGSGSSSSSSKNGKGRGPPKLYGF